MQSPSEHSAAKTSSRVAIQTFRLEEGTLRSLRTGLVTGSDFRKYLVSHYFALAQQRSEIERALMVALSEQCKSYSFEKWQRVVRSKWMLRPLSAHGSVASPFGERFNIGQIDPSLYVPFPALYLANDLPTALAESFGREAASDDSASLELALAKRDSRASWSASGTIESVLDIRTPKTLKKFVALFQRFTFPKHIKQLAEKLHIPPPVIAPSAKALLKTIMDPKWRSSPGMFNVPANSQIVGDLARRAGVEAILYKSVRGVGDCLAVFPTNFELSPSYIQLDDSVPVDHPNVITRLDMNSWRNLI